jgi:hypothetical protein
MALTRIATVMGKANANAATAAATKTTTTTTATTTATTTTRKKNKAAAAAATDDETKETTTQTKHNKQRVLSKAQRAALLAQLDNVKTDSPDPNLYYSHMEPVFRVFPGDA